MSKVLVRYNTQETGPDGLYRVAAVHYYPYQLKRRSRESFNLSLPGLPEPLREPNYQYELFADTDRVYWYRRYYETDSDGNLVDYSDDSAIDNPGDWELVLDIQKRNRQHEIREVRNRYLAQGVRVGDHLFTSDSISQSRIAQKSLSADYAKRNDKSWSIRWLTKENYSITMNADEMLHVGECIDDFLSKVYESYIGLVESDSTMESSDYIQQAHQAFQSHSNTYDWLT